MCGSSSINDIYIITSAGRFWQETNIALHLEPSMVGVAGRIYLFRSSVCLLILLANRAPNFVPDISSYEKHTMQTLSPSEVICHSRAHLPSSRRGIQLNFVLLEPVVYLQEHDAPSGARKNKPAFVRGCLHLKVIIPTRIRRICVSFRGQLQSEVPGGMLLSLLGS